MREKKLLKDNGARSLGFASYERDDVRRKRRYDMAYR